MMRKLLTEILTVAMVISLAACGGAKMDEKNNNDANSNEGSRNVIVPDVHEDTLGYKLWEIFEEFCAENPDASVEEIADAIITSKVGTASIRMPMTMEVEAGGYLMAITDGESLSFKSGILFGSGMRGVAFIGYVFELEKAEDVPAFIETLKEKCDPAWNVCTRAEMTAVGALGNIVFFVMCPMSV